MRSIAWHSRCDDGHRTLGAAGLATVGAFAYDRRMAWAGLLIGAVLGFSAPWVREAARHPSGSHDDYPAPSLLECLTLAGLGGGLLALVSTIG